MTKKFILASSILILIFLVFALLYSVAYMGHERYFYGWDYIAYQNAITGQVQTQQTSISGLLNLVYSTLGNDYNILWTVPVLPVLNLFHAANQRLPFILSLVTVYTIPLAVILALFASDLIAKRNWKAVGLALGVALLTPAFWLPALRGFPDTGGTLLIYLALFFYVYSKNRSWWQALLAGGFLAGGMIFRRHFIYDALAFYVASFLLDSIFILRDRSTPQGFLSRIISGYRSLFFTGIGTAATLLAAWPFTSHVLSQNFMGLYAGYQNDPFYLMQLMLPFYGLGTVILAVLGWGIVVFRRGAQDRSIWMAGLFGLLCILFWLFVARQNNPHYTLHFTPWILLGTVFLFWSILSCLRGWRRLLSLFFCMLLLLGNFLYTMASQTPALSSWIGTMIATENRPLYRPDYQEFVRLINYLRSETPGIPIYMVDSSSTQNNDLLLNAEKMLYPGDQKLVVLNVPQVDTRDQYPLEMLLRAEVVIVSKPFQHHLAKGEQEIVRTVYDIFQDNWSMANDFELLTEEFHFYPDITTRIYRRLQQTDLPTAVMTMAHMQQAILPDPPGVQADWVRLNYSSSDDSYLERTGAGYYIRVFLSGQQGILHWLYIRTLPESGRLSAVIASQSTCQSLSFSLLGYSADGEIIFSSRIESDGNVLQTSFERGQAQYLMLQIETQSEERCTLELNDLTVGGD